jgi:hypothetical protein
VDPTYPVGWLVQPSGPLKKNLTHVYITIGATQCHQLHYFNHHRHSKAKIKFFSRSLDCFCTKAYQWHWRNATGVDYLNIYPTLINALSTVHILKCLRRYAIVKSMHSRTRADIVPLTKTRTRERQTSH